jgi:hypothetical protein
MSKPDRALVAAKEWLTDAVCECGHLDVEHLHAPTALGRYCAECECYFWRPAVFRVERANVSGHRSQKSRDEPCNVPCSTAHNLAVRS